MSRITLTIDGIEITVDKDTMVLEAAEKAGVYIPRLCYHPDLGTSKGLTPVSHVYRGGEKVEGTEDKEYAGCQLCIVEIKGTESFQTACNTIVAQGMLVCTNSDRITAQRKRNLIPILVDHPHSCLTCGEQTTCDRTECSNNIPEEEHCCPKLGNCELQRVVNYIGIPENLGKYAAKEFPSEEDEPLFTRDYSLCVGCTRCVRVCKDVRGIEAIGFVYQDGKVLVGMLDESLADSGCRFCTACVEICPTGALRDKGEYRKVDREKALVPCKYACPAGIDVPMCISMVRNGDFSGALAVIREKVPFPASLGRTCIHPCEQECRRGEINEPISICALASFVAEHEDNEGWKKRARRESPTGKNVAIVGAGPAGLTAAYYLRKKGHGVTVYDDLERPGGVLYWGIPSYRLPLESVQKDISAILEEGVEVKTATRIGEDLPLKVLRDQYDALFLATGATASRRLKMEGMAYKDVLWGVDFLRDVNTGKEVRVKEHAIVVGGGSVAVHAALTAMRCGAKEVQLVCLESEHEMSAHPWDLEDGMKEGVSVNTGWSPVRILGKDGQVTGLECRRCISVFDGEGKFNPRVDDCAMTAFDGETVIIAVGRAADLSYLDSDIETTAWGTIKTEGDSHATTATGIFAGGDAVTGPRSIIEAVVEARLAASEIDAFLGGDGNIEEELCERGPMSPYVGKRDGFAYLERVSPKGLPVTERSTTFQPIYQVYSGQSAQKEAARCLQCQLRLMSKEQTWPPTTWYPFDDVTVQEAPEDAGVFQLIDETGTVIVIKGVMNVRMGLQEALDTYEAARFFDYKLDEMYMRLEAELIKQHLEQRGDLQGVESDEL